MWLERERIAQELFKKRREKEEQAQRDKEEREVRPFLIQERERYMYMHSGGWICTYNFQEDALQNNL